MWLHKILKYGTTTNIGGGLGGPLFLSYKTGTDNATKYSFYSIDIYSFIDTFSVNNNLNLFAKKDLTIGFFIGRYSICK